MKKSFVFVFLLMSLAACYHEVTLKNVIAVEAFDDMIVTYGTEFQTIIFPPKVSVTYSDNSTEELEVVFSQGTFDNTQSGTYPSTGTLTLTNGTTNTLELNASINVVINPLRLKLFSQNSSVLYEYFYDESNRLDYFKAGSYTEYHYTYSCDNKVTQRLRKLSSGNYPEKYFYNSNGTLDRIEFYAEDNTLEHILTYTYVDGKISRYDNSDQSVNTLKYRSFDYDAQNNIEKVSFDFGNPWSYTYIADKRMATPFILDVADPENQTLHPVETFTFVELSSYTSTYTYNDWGYPTEEVRTYPGNGNKKSTFTYKYE